MDEYKAVHELTGLYFKRTDGGAEYLCTSHIYKDNAPAGEHQYIGDISTAVIRLDGGLGVL